MTSQKIVREATRLTRSGQLVEATALLQRMLRGESAEQPSGTAAPDKPARLEPPTIDLKANVVEERAESSQTRAPSTPLRPKSPPRFEGIKDLSRFRLREPIRRAPLPAS